MTKSLIIAVIALAGCSNVILSEESFEVCANGGDDDGDGLTDCDDPSCDGSGVCETTMEGCTNGADDDGDGATDCAEQNCRDSGYCDSFDADCDVAPQTGCPAG